MRVQQLNSRVPKFGSALIFLLGALSGCSSKPVGSDVAPSGPYRLELKFVPNRIEKSRFETATLTRRSEKGQLLNERVETTDFTVKTQHLAQAPEGAPFNFRVKTTSKDGLADLHELAFPELGETLDIQVTAKGDVLSAGQYPKESIFFVPALSLPNEPVNIGDTWRLQRRWYSLKGGLPMQFDIVSIFRRVIPCAGGTCAEIELSGIVGVADELGEQMKQQQTGMQSDLRGRYLFNLQTGSVLWSDVRNREHLISGQWKIDILSCLVEALDEPAAEAWPGARNLRCDPSHEDPDRLP